MVSRSACCRFFSDIFSSSNERLQGSSSKMSKRLVAFEQGRGEKSRKEIEHGSVEVS
jgi:hypothetical protein